MWLARRDDGNLPNIWRWSALALLLTGFVACKSSSPEPGPVYATQRIEPYTVIVPEMLEERPGVAKHKVASSFLTAEEAIGRMSTDVIDDGEAISTAKAKPIDEVRFVEGEPFEVVSFPVSRKNLDPRYRGTDPHGGDEADLECVDIAVGSWLDDGRYRVEPVGRGIPSLGMKPSSMSFPSSRSMWVVTVYAEVEIVFRIIYALEHSEAEAIVTLGDEGCFEEFR
jgi:hypothetical protein